MPDAKKYRIAGKEFTLKFPNYAVREAARDYEYQYPTWYLYRNETLGYLRIILDGDVDAFTIDSIADEDTKTIQEINADFFSGLTEIRKNFVASMTSSKN